MLEALYRRWPTFTGVELTEIQSKGSDESAPEWTYESWYLALRDDAFDRDLLIAASFAFASVGLDTLEGVD